MPRRPTEDSLKVRALAKAHGKTERWARKQREKNTPIWQEFCEGQQVASPANREEDAQERTDLEKAELICREAWTAWQGMNGLLNGALKDPGKQDIIPALARATREARKQWEDATKHRESLLRAAGLWIPVERVMAIRTHLKPLGSILEKLEVTIAGRLVPENRHEFYRAFEAALPEWNEGIQKMDEYMKSLLPC
ncbi:hypothetical protein [Akkermansia sp.]|uniref:hypothetical protein n=1 Tax=Akkermansia sp. TaxID=1872421 RepID=UPI003A8E0F57